MFIFIFLKIMSILILMCFFVTMDIIKGLFTAFYNDHGALVEDKNLIAKKYRDT